MRSGMEGTRILQSNRPDPMIASRLPVGTSVARFMTFNATLLQFEKAINCGVQIFPDGSCISDDRVEVPHWIRKRCSQFYVALNAVKTGAIRLFILRQRKIKLFASPTATAFLPGKRQNSKPSGGRLQSLFSDRGGVILAPDRLLPACRACEPPLVVCDIVDDHRLERIPRRDTFKKTPTIGSEFLLFFLTRENKRPS